VSQLLGERGISADETVQAQQALPSTHTPVLYAPVVDALAIQACGVYLDGTFGRGGHARAIRQQLGPHGKLLLMDKDPQAIAVAQRDFADDQHVSIRHGSFASLADWEVTNAGLDGVLLDLGVSSPQLDQAARGFSFSKDGPLDMRMNPQAGYSAAQWLAQASEEAIAQVLWRYGEERASRKIARAIISRRAVKPLANTLELAELIASVLPRGQSKTHPATRSFQAIRIHINNELAELEAGLAAATARLKPGGRLVVISFHSLEDRIVKHFLRSQAHAPANNRRLPAMHTFRPVLEMIGKALKPTAEECAANPRARSAILRVARKCGSE